MGAISPQDIEKRIGAEYYVAGHSVYQDGPVHPALSTLTICILVLTNGFTVIGESNCVDPADFDADIGRMVAKKRAVDKVWELEGYLMRWQRYRGDQDVKAQERQQG